MNDLTPSELRMLKALIDYENEHKAFPSCKERARIIGVSVQRATLVLSGLLKKGYVTRQSKYTTKTSKCKKISSSLS